MRITAQGLSVTETISTGSQTPSRQAMLDVRFQSDGVDVPVDLLAIARVVFSDEASLRYDTGRVAAVIHI